MAIEDDDIRDREVWNAVSRHWYSKASDKALTVGRLYHHLAILARPNALQQLFYYAKSLCVPIPFASARESIMTLFDPILKATQPSDLAPIDAVFVKAHGILFSGSLQEQFSLAMEEFLGKLDSHIDRRWIKSGDPNVLPFMHVTMAFIDHLAPFPDAIALIEDDFPWELSCAMLNSFLLSYREYGWILNDKFPGQDKEPAPRPLPEDFAMKGLPWVEGYLPNDWFSNEKIDDDEKYFEAESMTGDRKERILWLGCRIAKHGEWLLYDEKLHQFGVAPKYQGRAQDVMDMDDADPTASGRHYIRQ
ncbi:hypothetical protein DL764_006014 [Monosporascus ibericus]|uniref:DNA/RNA-binding domain-containing protein n=1 Tax=Monosporascus ibericus TaxID=155417 RepID=A0A4V1XA90_9PEZI|nr:hypothetical protein DL764_006014 [Monosporascus ibericus]